MSFLPSPSKFELADMCQFPWLTDERWPKQRRTSFKGFGTAVSEAAEMLTVWGDCLVDEIAGRNELDETDAKRFRYAVEHLRELNDLELNDLHRAAEVVLTVHVPSGGGRVLQQLHGRDYSDERPGERSGPVDLIRIVADGRLVVRDWKTGRHARGRSAKTHVQLRAYGLAAARAFGVDAVTIELAHVDEHGIYIDSHDVDAFELEVIAQQLRDLFAKFDERRNAIPKPGRHCRDMFCPMVATCPATRASLAAVAYAAGIQHPISVWIDSAEQAAHMHERLPMVKAAIAELEAAVKDFATREPFTCSDGKTYGLAERTRRAIDCSPEAIGVMKSKLGDFEADAAIEKKVTKAAIGAAARRVAEKRKGAALEREILAELAELGAIRESTYTTLEVINNGK